MTLTELISAELLEVAWDYCLEQDMIMPDAWGTFFDRHSVSHMSVSLVDYDLAIWDFSLVHRSYSSCHSSGHRQVTRSISGTTAPFYVSSMSGARI